MRYRVETREGPRAEWRCEPRHCFTYNDLALASELAQALSKNTTCYSQVRIWDIEKSLPVVVYTNACPELVRQKTGRMAENGTTSVVVVQASRPAVARYVDGTENKRRKYPRGLKGLLLRLADKL